MHERAKNGESDRGQEAKLGDFHSQFSHDLGEADPRIRLALANEEIAPLLSALCSSRIFIALVAEIAGESSAGDKSSDMSVACLRATDGRLGLLGFTGLDSLAEWNPRARPVPISAHDAAEAALDENAQALILDLAGPCATTLTLPDVVALSGRDQRERAVHLLHGLLGEMAELVTFSQRPDSVLQLDVPDSMLERVQEIVRTNSALHSFVPAGIAMRALGGGQVDRLNTASMVGSLEISRAAELP